MPECYNRSMNGTVLITGGAGFIGSHLAERLLSEGTRVRVLDNFSTGGLSNLPFAARFRDQLEVVEGDIRDLAILERLSKGVEVVFHQAAMRSVPRSVDDPLGAHDNNVTGTLYVLEAARRAGVRRVVYASSSSVYGDRPELPKVEDQMPAPISPYAASKAAGEYYGAVWNRLYGVQTVGLRYFNVFGPVRTPPPSTRPSSPASSCGRSRTSRWRCTATAPSPATSPTSTTWWTRI